MGVLELDGGGGGVLRRSFGSGRRYHGGLLVGDVIGYPSPTQRTRGQTSSGHYTLPHAPGPGADTADRRAAPDPTTGRGRRAEAASAGRSPARRRASRPAGVRYGSVAQRYVTRAVPYVAPLLPVGGYAWCPPAVATPCPLLLRSAHPAELRPV